MRTADTSPEQLEIVFRAISRDIPLPADHLDSDQISRLYALADRLDMQVWVELEVEEWLEPET